MHRTSWDCGAVVGDRWDGDGGTLHVAFARAVNEAKFCVDELQELALDTYTLRPCLGENIANFMPPEMKSTNQGAYAFLRSSPEAETVPLFDMQTSQVVNVSIKYVLDFWHIPTGHVPEEENVVTNAGSRV